MVTTRQIKRSAYVFGADGMLGRALCAEAETRRIEVFPIGRGVDITDRGAVGAALALMSHLDIVFNAAAQTNMEACELDYEQAFAVNALGAQNIARQARGDNLFQVSTGAVFDGLPVSHHDRLGYDEFTTPRPMSAYARTKYAGEELVRKAFAKAAVVRLGHLYGPGGRNGLSTARAKFLRGEAVSINESCKIAPTYVGDAARLLLDLAISEPFRGSGHRVVHVAPEGSTTGKLFAERLWTRVPVIRARDRCQVEGDNLVYHQAVGTPGKKIVGVSGSVIAENVAWRPPFQLIRSRLLRSYGVTPIGPWEEGLDRYLQTPAFS